jgi:hypothetical protein
MFLSALGAVFLGSSAGCSSPLPPPQGVVIQKGIFGERNEQRIPVLSVKNESVTVQDDVLGTVLSQPDELANTTVPMSIHKQLKQRYENIYYYVKLRKLSASGPLIETKEGKRPKVPVLGNSPRYLISRETFGKLLIEDHIEYTLSLFDNNSIGTVTIILRDGIIQEKKPALDTNPNTPPYRITVSHGTRSDGDLVTLTYFADLDVYKAANINTSPYFGVIFENQTRPTIKTFTPEPDGNI